MPRLRSFTAREALDVLQMFNWVAIESGRHPNYWHDELKKKIPIQYTGKGALPPGTLKKIFKDAHMLWVLDKIREGQSVKEIRKNWSGSLLGLS